MRQRLLVSLSILAVGTLAPLRASGQWSPPLAPDGHPDLEGTWVSKSATPLERPKQLEGRTSLTDAEVAEFKRRAERLFHSGNNDFAAGDNAFLAVLENPDHYKSPTATGGADHMIELEFDNRTSLIVDPPDGKIPPFTPEAQRRRATEARSAHPPAGPQELNSLLRCITYGVPRLGGRFGSGPDSYYQIVQTPGYVMLMMEVIHDARIIPLDGSPHLPPNVRTWNGDARGRWEGKTLVVDTTNFSPHSNYLGSAENLHLVERFTRVAADEIDYEITVEDPTTWTRPWTAMVRLKQTEDKIYEYACQEGNATMMEDILRAARAQDKIAEEAAQKSK